MTLTFLSTYSFGQTYSFSKLVKKATVETSSGNQERIIGTYQGPYRFVFETPNDTQIKKLFASLFKVNVIAVNTHIPPRKKIRVGMAQGFRPTYKRAIITFKEGDSINYNLANVNN